MTNDRTMDVLSRIQQKIATEIPLDLIKKCYETEKNFIFEKDRNKPMEILKQLVEQYVESESNH